MWLLLSTSLLLLQSLQGASSMPQGLTLLTSTSCICPGRQLVYECTVVGPTIQYTVWRGSALDCSGISLRHGEFVDTGRVSGTCNNGAILGLITSYMGDRFTSQLIVNTSLDMNGKELECAFDDGANRMPVNTSIVRIRTAPLPPPNNVQLTNVQPGQITFNWTSVDTLCDSVSYNIIASNCGQCPSTTNNTTATCTDVVASGQVCTFIIQAVVCGTITGSQASPTTVIMEVPRVPNIHTVPRYDHMTGGLLSIASSFDSLDSVTVSDGFENHVVSYNLSYKDASTQSGNICSPITTIPASVCAESGVCKHVFEVSSSFCHPSTDITVTVTAASMFGSGMESDPQTIGSTNQFFDVDFEFDVDTLRITCIFVNTTQTNGERSCTVMFGPGQDLSSCRNLSQSLKSEQRANVSRMSVNLPIFLTKLTSNNVCLVVRASDNRHTVEAERMLTVISGCDKNHLGDGTVLPNGIRCGLPLFTAGIKNGIVCYTGTGSGAIAIHHCHNCGSAVSSSAHSVRTCLPNGTWNGTVPHCQCSTTAYIAISMGVVIILITTILIIVIVFLVRSRLKVKRMLMERKAKENMRIYEDINISEIIDSMKNVAYEAPSQTQI